MISLTSYDKRAEYKDGIKPLVERIDAYCVEQKIPYYFTAAVQNSEEGTEYVSTARSAAPMGVGLKDEQVVEHIKVNAGFIVMHSEEMPDIELGDKETAGSA